jgi:protein O-mannosyl-transferase
LFLLGLMSKTVIASLPAALLVVFWWQRGKVSWKRDVPPLIPFFMAGIGTGLLTAWIERKFIGAEGSEFHFSMVERMLIAGRDVWFYLGKIFWPVDLAFIYPRWTVSQAVWWQYLFPAAALLLLGVLVWQRWRGPLAGLLFFVGTLFPALGFFNVYPFRFSFVADHFQYLASLGPLTLAAAGISAAPGLFRKRKPYFGPIICAILLLTLGTLTWRQCGMYASAETLWLDTIRLNPNCWMAHNSLGNTQLQKGQLDEAIVHFKKTLELKPDAEGACNNLGNAYLQKGEVDQAIAQYQKALAIKPDYADACNNLGNILLQTGKVDEAISHYEKALTIKPDCADAHNNLGTALLRKDRVDEGIAQYQKALAIKPDYANARINLDNALRQRGNVDDATTHHQNAPPVKPDDADACVNLGNVLLREDKVDEAITQYQKALQIKPDNAKAHNNLGIAFQQKGNMGKAITQYQEALQIEPADLGVQNNLAWLLATCAEASLRNGNKAVDLGQQANTLAGGENPVILHTLAAALAEAGRFSEAVETAQHALRLAEAQSNTKLVEALQSELDLYQAGRPFHSLP